MSSVTLSEGAIERICNYEEGLTACLQVTDIRLILPANLATGTPERYRILLSDGRYSQQGMLAVQMNGLVKSGVLQKGSVVRLLQYNCSQIQNRRDKQSQIVIHWYTCRIIIVTELEVAEEKRDIIGQPKGYPGLNPGDAKPSAQTQSSVDQAGMVSGSTSHTNPSSSAGPDFRATTPGGLSSLLHRQEHGSSMQSYAGYNLDHRRYGSTARAPLQQHGTEFGGGNSGPSFASGSYGLNAEVPQDPMNPRAHHHPAYQQPPPMYMNRGPIARNDAAPRTIPIAALNPYQGRWTIKARVTTKSELRHYNNARGDGKVFSFDLLDADGGEIRVTCFNSVADQFYNQIEAGRVYYISKGSLRPAQKNFNHLHNANEIFLETTSIVQPCFEDDSKIPKQQFHFCPISDVESMEANSVVDIIGVVSSITPSSSIMRKNGTETLKRTLQLKDMSGRSVELTLWGSFCSAEGQTLQNMCDSGLFPVLAVKAGRVSEFNGKSMGTLSTSQLFIEPDYPEAQQLKEWFDREGQTTPSISISRELSSPVRADTRKMICQIKDEKLGTSEKPDWIVVCASISFIKMDNFCYTACPIMIGDRQCNKKVANNGDGKWRCDRCDQSVDECDFRYILQLQIQDHTGLTWVTAFQESGEEIMGVPAKTLYFMKYEQQDDEKFTEIIHNVLFHKYIFKLKVKEETFSDEQRVKSTVVKAERLKFQSESRFLLDLMEKMKSGNFSAPSLKAENSSMNIGGSNAAHGITGVAPPSNSRITYGESTMASGRDTGLSPSKPGQHENQFGGLQYPMASASRPRSACATCGTGSGNSGGECYKCHQFGHWARDCPGLSSVPPAYVTNQFTLNILFHW
ncbi:Replication protein A 70 kDa DNA-binding subunit C-like protein [Drosera capensis]